MTVLLVACRLAHYAATMVLFGASLFALYALKPAMHPDQGEQILFEAWLRRLQWSAVALALLSLLGWFAAAASMISGGWPVIVELEALRAVVLETTFGHVWTLRLALVVVLICALWTSPPGRYRRTSVLSALLAASLVGVGHAAMSSGGIGMARQAADALHLVASGAWLGGLAALGYLLNRTRSDPHDGWRAMVRHALPRFSHMGYAAVGLLILTGCINASFLMPNPNALFETLYGRVLAAKLGLFMVMAFIAVHNRINRAPRIVAGSLSAGDLTALGRNVAIEQGLGLGILAIVSVLGTLAPPPPGAP